MAARGLLLGSDIEVEGEVAAATEPGTTETAGPCATRYMLSGAVHTVLQETMLCFLQVKGGITYKSKM